MKKGIPTPDFVVVVVKLNYNYILIIINIQTAKVTKKGIPTPKLRRLVTFIWLYIINK